MLVKRQLCRSPSLRGVATPRMVRHTPFATTHMVGWHPAWWGSDAPYVGDDGVATPRMMGWRINGSDAPFGRVAMHRMVPGIISRVGEVAVVVRRRSSVVRDDLARPIAIALQTR